jgi:hypothetical protein
MRYLAKIAFATVLALTLLPAPLPAQQAPEPRAEPAPAAVVLSNGQRWERISLRYIDARVLAPLFGAAVLPTTARPEWGVAVPELMPVFAGWLAPGAALLPFLQQGSPGGLTPGAPGGTGPANPRGLPVLVDPVTNALIVDP